MSADRRRWFLLDASPDIHRQIAQLPVAAPGSVRASPVEGVVLTDAELDHTLGIPLLREGRSLQLWATPAAIALLERDSRILPVTRAFARVDVTPLPVGAAIPLLLRDGTPSGLTAEAMLVAGDPPRFATGAPEAGHTVGLEIRESATGARCAFVPGCGALDDALLARLDGADLLLFDGTFWTDDEPARAGIGAVTARGMGHVPISGPDGSLGRLSRLAVGRVVYTHINNTNPVLVERSRERRVVTGAGATLAEDGMEFTLTGAGAPAAAHTAGRA